MPFTVSHIAAVLPLHGHLAGRLLGRRAGAGGLPLAPLALGSMAPDVWLFLGVSRVRDLAHSPVGVVTVDIAVVIVAGLVWHHLLRPPVLALLPPLAARLPPLDRAPGAGHRSPAWAATWVLAALGGATTHVVWDLFTHGDRRVLHRLPFLEGTALGIDRQMWLQYGSSALGLLVVAAVAAHWWRTTPLHFRPEKVTDRPSRVAVLVALVAMTLAGGAYRADPLASFRFLLESHFRPWRLRTITTDIALGAGVALAVSIVVVATAWHLCDRRRRRSRDAGGQPVEDDVEGVEDVDDVGSRRVS